MSGSCSSSAIREGGRGMLYAARPAAVREGVMEETDSWEEVPATAARWSFE